MNDTSPAAVSGNVFDGTSPAARAARLELAATSARLVAGDFAEDFPLAALSVSPRVFSAPRFVNFPNGFQLVCPDDRALERLPSASETERPVVWLEQRVGVAVVAVLATFAGLAFFYVFGLPRLADAVARRISPEHERAFGQQTLELLDRTISPTDLDEPTLEQVRRGFAALVTGMLPGRAPQLEFRDAPGIGPNAFALPGAIVVVTDQLVTTCTPDETVAILGHELGHVRHRHALRHLVQELGISAVASVLSGDASTLSLSVSGLPLILARARYSQAFEVEADSEGFALSRRAGYSPELFASCLRRIAKKHEGEGAGLPSYVSSHPPDAERIARAHAAAVGFEGHPPPPASAVPVP
jgi:Zn-dependent protease with chaperone function